MAKKIEEFPEIITDESLLVERADEVNVLGENREVRDTIIKIKHQMRKQGLTSLSAPAIGINKRIFCIDFKDKDIKTFINPIITQSKGNTLAKETCSSLPGRTFLRPRYTDISVMYETIQSKVESRQLIGLAAIVFQHEIDHLDSVLLSDIGLEIDEDYESATDEEKQEIIGMYLDSLDMRAADIKKLIEQDEIAKQAFDAVQYMTGVARGEIETEKMPAKPIKEIAEEDIKEKMNEQN